MGKYINQDSKGNPLPHHGKTRALIEDSATVIKNPSWQKDLVCVVDNGLFEAAAHCFDEREFMNFNDPMDHRRKTWLSYPHAERLAK